MYDLIIIGGGVAAFSAALFAARRGLEVLVVGKDLGGQANSTDLIENYPGVNETGGLELVSNIKKQAEKYGSKFVNAEVSKIKPASSSFIITAYGKQYKATCLILAFGKTPRDLGVLGEEEFKGKGVSYCATCDAPLFKNKIVAVVGIGDVSLEAALITAKYAKKVYILSKTDKLIGHPALLKAVGKRDNIELICFAQIEQIKGKSSVEEMLLKDLRANQRKILKVNGILVELGYVAETDLVKNLVNLDEAGQIIVSDNQATSVDGIFAAGDVTSKPYKQAVISAGEGAAAALAAFDWIMRQQGSQGMTSDWTQIKHIK